ncbi:hypothetical protein D3C85_1682030 [compost metagenome]
MYAGANGRFGGYGYGACVVDPESLLPMDKLLSRRSGLSGVVVAAARRLSR